MDALVLVQTQMKAALVGSVLVPMLAMAAGPTLTAGDATESAEHRPAAIAPSPAPAAASDARGAHRSTSPAEERKLLESALLPGQGVGFYHRELERLGYAITAVNSDEPEYAEYEIVKGPNTFELAIEFDRKAVRATKVQVSPNVWRADSTRQVMEGRRLPR